VDVNSAVARAAAQLESAGRVLAVRPLAGGVSADVFAVDIETPAVRRRVVFRRHPADGLKHHDESVIAKEFRLLTALHGQGLEVTEPYLYDGDDIDGPYLVVEWIEGSTTVENDDLPRALEQMADFLARLHALDQSVLPLDDLAPIEDPRRAVVPYLPATEIGERVLAALESADLGDVVARPTRVVLLHGDYWPGNVIWRDGRLCAVIDWEDACLGDPLADLATARVELLCQYGPDAMDQFTERYLAAAVQRSGSVVLESLPVWEVYVSAAALAKMGEWGLPPEDEARRRRLTAQFFERAAREVA
jgi:aminoglycoside phosphotransferase (APT) family kinase protein